MQLRIISCELLSKYLEMPGSLLLDLREQEEYQKNHIPGALWADWETLEENIPDLIQKLGYRPSWIILYCSHGNTSLLTARDLARNGYPVASLNGGYSSWKKYISKE